jgi:hypothetical protein
VRKTSRITNSWSGDKLWFYRVTEISEATAETHWVLLYSHIWNSWFGAQPQSRTPFGIAGKSSSFDLELALSMGGTRDTFEGTFR